MALRISRKQPKTTKTLTSTFNIHLKLNSGAQHKHTAL